MTIIWFSYLHIKWTSACKSNSKNCLYWMDNSNYICVSHCLHLDLMIKSFVSSKVNTHGIVNEKMTKTFLFKLVARIRRVSQVIKLSIELSEWQKFYSEQRLHCNTLFHHTKEPFNLLHNRFERFWVKVFMGAMNDDCSDRITNEIQVNPFHISKPRKKCSKNANEKSFVLL